MKQVYELRKGVLFLGGPLLECRSFLQKGIGFMGKSLPEDGHGFIFRQTGSLHTCFMRFHLDVIFLDRDQRVLRVVPNMGPWRFAFGGRGAAIAIEAPCGTLQLGNIQIGDVLVLMQASEACLLHANGTLIQP